MTRAESVLQFIRAYHARHGYAPTLREIGGACRLSTSVVSYQLGILEGAGHLTVARQIARGIVLTETAPSNADWLAIPRGDCETLVNRSAR